MIQIRGLRLNFWLFPALLCSLLASDLLHASLASLSSATSPISQDALVATVEKIFRRYPVLITMDRDQFRNALIEIQSDAHLSTQELTNLRLVMQRATSTQVSAPQGFPELRARAAAKLAANPPPPMAHADIVGATIPGLVSGLVLARSGYQVEVHDIRTPLEKTQDTPFLVRASFINELRSIDPKIADSFLQTFNLPKVEGQISLPTDTRKLIEQAPLGSLSTLEVEMFLRSHLLGPNVKIRSSLAKVVRREGNSFDVIGSGHTPGERDLVLLAEAPSKSNHPPGITFGTTSAKETYISVKLRAKEPQPSGSFKFKYSGTTTGNTIDAATILVNSTEPTHVTLTANLPTGILEDIRTTPDPAKREEKLAEYLTKLAKAAGVIGGFTFETTPELSSASTFQHQLASRATAGSNLLLVGAAIGNSHWTTSGGAEVGSVSHVERLKQFLLKDEINPSNRQTSLETYSNLAVADSRLEQNVAIERTFLRADQEAFERQSASDHAAFEASKVKARAKLDKATRAYERAARAEYRYLNSQAGKGASEAANKYLQASRDATKTRLGIKTGMVGWNTYMMTHYPMYLTILKRVKSTHSALEAANQQAAQYGIFPEPPRNAFAPTRQDGPSPRAPDGPTVSSVERLKEAAREAKFAEEQYVNRRLALDAATKEALLHPGDLFLASQATSAKESFDLAVRELFQARFERDSMLALLTPQERAAALAQWKGETKLEVVQREFLFHTLRPTLQPNNRTPSTKPPESIKSENARDHFAELATRRSLLIQRTREYMEAISATEAANASIENLGQRLRFLNKLKTSAAGNPNVKMSQDPHGKGREKFGPLQVKELGELTSTDPDENRIAKALVRKAEAEALKREALTKLDRAHEQLTLLAVFEPSVVFVDTPQERSGSSPPGSPVVKAPGRSSGSEAQRFNLDEHSRDSGQSGEDLNEPRHSSERSLEGQVPRGEPSHHGLVLKPAARWNPFEPRPLEERGLHPPEVHKHGPNGEKALSAGARPKSGPPSAGHGKPPSM